MKQMTGVIPFTLALALAFAGACAAPAHQPAATSPVGDGPGPAASGPAALDVRPRACRITAKPIGGCPRDQCGVELEGFHVTGYQASAAGPGEQLDITEEGELVIRDNAHVRGSRALVGGTLLFRDESGQERVKTIEDYGGTPATDADDGGRAHHRYFLRDGRGARWFELACGRP